MTGFFYHYGLFLAKTLTIVIAIAAVIILVSILSQRRKPALKESIEIKRLNQKYADMAAALNESMLSKDQLKKLKKDEKDKHKAEKQADRPKKHIFVIEFHGDIRASAVTSLREEITAILTIASEEDEVFVRLESAGGMVHSYGLAASQLLRIRNKNIPLTIAVDKVAASGGYMMACVANHIIAAPFAILGSIGVLAQLPNFNRLLKKHDIEYNEFTAGEFKRTVTVFGENSEKDKAKFTEQIEDTHVLFKDFISQNRPGVDITKVATGEHWFGTRALENNLVDELKTSDDYLLENSEHSDIFEIKYRKKKSVLEKLGHQAQYLLDRVRLGQ